MSEHYEWRRYARYDVKWPIPNKKDEPAMTDHLKEARELFARKPDISMQGAWAAILHILSHLEQQEREKAGASAPHVWTFNGKPISADNFPKTAEDAIAFGKGADIIAAARAAGAKEERERISTILKKHHARAVSHGTMNTLQQLILEIEFNDNRR